MRILHVVPSYWPARRYGGTIVAVHGLCKALAACGHEVEVFTTSIDGRGDSAVPHDVAVDHEGVKIWYFRSRHLRRLYWAPSMARALAARLPGFDIVHLHSLFLWPTWAAARAARCAAVPYVLAPRGMLVQSLIHRKSRWLKTVWIQAAERRTIEDAAALHLTSKLEAEECRAFGFKVARLAVVPNGVELPEDESDQPVTQRRTSVLFLGRVNWKKGLENLIDAVTLLPGVQLVIAGNDEDGERDRLQRRVHDRGIGGRVAWVGPLYGAAKTALLREAGLLALPSLSENFGNVVLEALAQGCPVVVTPSVGLADFVARAGAGLVAEREPAALACAIGRLLEDAQLRERMGHAGRRAVREHYGWATVARRMEGLYAELLAASRPAPAGR